MRPAGGESSSSIGPLQPEVTSTATPEPFNPSATSGIGFQVGWMLFQLATWFTIATWIHPKLLGSIGLHGAAAWLEHHLWVRILASPVLLILGALSAFTPMGTSGRRAAVDALAVELGATRMVPPGMDRAHGISRGPGLCMPVGQWFVEVTLWSRRSRVTTVARARVATASELCFDARGTGRDLGPLRGLQQRAMAGALENAVARSEDPRAAQVVRALAYLGADPIRTGHASLDRLMVLRSNQPEAARDLFATDYIVSAVESLNRRSNQWAWSCHPGDTPGTRDVTIECPVALDDVDALRTLRTLMSGVLDHLAGQEKVAA